MALRRTLLVSAAAVLVLTAAGVLLGYTSLAGLSGDGTWAPRAGTEPVPAARIATTNLAAAALLFSGAATGGIGTAVGLLLVSAYVGATWAVATGNLGWQRVLEEIGPYAGLEFGGLLLVGVGGLLPAVHAGRAVLADARPRLSAYLDALVPAAVVAVAGAAVVAVGAVVESALL
ncbi:hypothetical protein [Kocuria flava]|uniref:hypothetical protein n=1 Tax=Kocuria flava TaxID=446860 RepID=UPI002F94F36E